MKEKFSPELLKKKDEIFDRGNNGDFYITADELEELKDYLKDSNNKNTFDKHGNIPKILGLVSLLAVGGTISNDIYQHSPGQIKFKQELSDEKYKSQEYHTHTVKNDTLKFLSVDFISDIALDNNKDLNAQLLLKIKSGLLAKEGGKELDSNERKNIEEVLSLCNSKINELKKELSDDDKLKAKEKIIEMMIYVERAKLELIKHIESDEYLIKIAKEMIISKEAAKEHQKVRIDNIKNISYDFKNNMTIFVETKGRGYAYYDSHSNKIVMPYNVDMKDKNNVDYFYQVLEHEILHGTTQFNKGISVQVKDHFNEAFVSKENEETFDIIYFLQPGELIVRKQILDLEMEKLGIKKYGEKFTNEHYKKLLILKNEGKLSPDSSELIEHIKPEEFSKIINELAENNNGREKGDYYNPEWDYGNEENQA